MFDLIIRVILHPFAYLGVFRNTELTLQEKKQESENIYSFTFTAPKLPAWKAGQHAIFSFKNIGGGDKGWRPFSVASAPHEGVIKICTSFPETPSPFKQKLLSLNIGDKIKMRGPFGEFFVEPNCKEVVAVVGGIGITPLRAIVSDLAKKQNHTKVHLIYSARSEDLYTYKEELANWCLENTNISITYTTTPDEVNVALDKEIEVLGNLATYFISGSPKMIEVIRDRLKQKGIQKIVNDSFKGY